MKRRLFLLGSLGFAALPVTAVQPRPLVLIFPTSLGRLAVVTQEKAGPDGLLDGDRINLAALAVRNQLDEEKVVVTLLYDSNDTYFKKALESAKIKLAPGTEPDETLRLKIGAQVGAHYILTVFSRLSVDQPQTAKPVKVPELTGKEKKIAETQGQKPLEQVNLTTPGMPTAPTLELEAIEIKPGAKAGRRWQDKIAMAAANEGGRRPVGSIPNGMQSAARTLVYRFLGGPLREFSRNAVDPSLLPPPSVPKPPVVEVPTTDFDAESTRLQREGMDLLSHDKVPAAIVLLRQAVNYQPRSATPRLLLARAYLQARRPGEAANEVRRALKLAEAPTPEQRAELTRLLAHSLVEDGDIEGATLLFNQLLAENPANTEARLGLTELLLSRGQNEAAEIQYRLIRERDPDSVEAGQGLARLLLARGALEDAIKEARSSNPPIRHLMATLIFVETATGLAGRMVQNRTAWEENKISREVFYKAATTQAGRAKLLAELLTAAPPTETAADIVKIAHNRRVLAANLLSQALGSLQGFLETGELAGGVRARTLLNEFYTEMKDSQNPKV